MEQTYVNVEKVEIEATYLFPIHPAGAVNRFEVTLSDGRKYVGVVKKKEDASKAYERAISRGQGAYLLQSVESSGEIFRCSVGNLKPGNQITVTIG